MTFNPGGDPFRLRLGVENLASTVSGEFKLYLKKNSGSYAAITTSSTGGVQSADASSDADNTKIRVPRIYPFSDWQLSNAAVDLDFASNRVYPNGAFTNYVSCSRASIGYAKTAAGTLTQFGNNQLRITDLGLLVEDARTNYIFPSIPNHYTGAGSDWYPWYCVVTEDAATAPDGATTASRINESADNNNHRAANATGTFLGNNGTTYTASAYIKDGNRGFGQFYVHDDFSKEFVRVIFNLATGVITNTPASSATVWTLVGTNVEAYGDGWWRVSITATFNADTYIILNIGLASDGTTVSYAGDVNKYIYCWGAQLEIGNFPSSYIPTTTAAAARAEDGIEFTGSAGTITASGTLSIVVDIKVYYPGVLIAQSSRGRLFLWPGQSVLQVSDTAAWTLNGVLIADFAATGVTVSGSQGAKVGICGDGSGRTVAGGGVSSQNATAISSGDPLTFGVGGYGMSGYWRRITLWNSRLADATLQGHTAP